MIMYRFSFRSFFCYFFSILFILFVYFGINNNYNSEESTLNGFFCAIINLAIEIISLLFIVTNWKYLSFTPIKAIVTLWIFFVVISQIMSFLAGNGGISNVFINIVYVLYWPLCFLFASVFAYVYPMKLNKFVNLFLLCFIESLILYVIILNTKGIFSYMDLESSNEIYYPLLFSPWLLMLKNEKVKFLCFVLLGIAVLYSTKRSALLAYVLIAVPYYIQLGQRIFRTRFFALFLLVFLAIGSVAVFDRIDSLMDNRLTTRIENVGEDRGSGRLDIWNEVVKQQKCSSFTEWIFGHGHNSVQKYVIVFGKGFSAHNDYLQVLFDYGIFSLLLIFSFLFLLIKRLFRLYHTKSIYFIPYYASIVLFLVLTMVSHLIKYPTYFVFLTIFWGAIEAIGGRKLLVNN